MRKAMTPEEKKIRLLENGRRSYAKNKARVLAKQKARRIAHPELDREKTRKYRAANPDKVREAARKYVAKNKDHMRALQRAYAEKHPERMMDAKVRWREKEENKEKERAYSRNWRADNLAHDKATNKIWRLENKPKLAAIQSQFRANRLKATPKWADRRKIEEFYETAEALGMHTGDWWHVDHIVPLNSKRVCGLHCEQNLRVIPLVDNVRKGNRHWPDM